METDKRENIEYRRIKSRYPMDICFAHTLDDMADKYLKNHTIELKAEVGTLTTKDLEYVKSSKSTILTLNNLIYKLSQIDGDIYKYVCTSEGEDNKAKFNQIEIDTSTGNYKSETLYNEIEEAPDDGNLYARKNKEWVKIQDDYLIYSFRMGGLNKEVISFGDIRSLDYYENVEETKIEKSYNLNSDSYIWFISLTPIEYIATVGGLEIDYIKQKNNIIVDDTTTYYCYRTTYPLLKGKWNFIIKFEEITE